MESLFKEPINPFRTWSWWVMDTIVRVNHDRNGFAWVGVPRAGLRDEDSYLLEPGRTITGFDGWALRGRSHFLCLCFPGSNRGDERETHLERVTTPSNVTRHIQGFTAHKNSLRQKQIAYIKKAFPEKSTTLLNFAFLFLVLPVRLQIHQQPSDGTFTSVISW